VHALLIQTIVSAIDYYYYQTFTIPTWNILKYNAMQGDDTLYGTEPLSYYIKNIALNFNLMAILATFAFPILCGKYIFFHLQQKAQCHQQQQEQPKQPTLLCMMLYTLSPMLIWLVLVCPRPHKEERFLFPIYPFIALACAYALQEIIHGIVIFITAFPTLRTMVSSIHTTDESKSLPSQTKLVVIYRVRSFLYLCFVVPVTLLSVSRSLALHTYYMAPLYIYSSLYDSIHTDNAMASTKFITANATTTTTTTTTTIVCVAGEWYRFPGSFLLPQGSTLAFLPSSFKGQLPQPFIPSLGSAATPDQIPQPFNSRNREEPSRYIHDILLCDYAVELFSSRQERNDQDAIKQHLLRTDQWEEVASFPFLDADATSSTLGRTLYIPPWLLKRLHIPIYFAKYSLFHQIKL
jgi:alpha-1,2-mannosyltransferase